MTTSDNSPISQKITLNEAETASLLQDLRDRFAPALGGVLEGRVFIVCNVTATNLPGKAQTATVNVQIVKAATTPKTD